MALVLEVLRYAPGEGRRGATYRLEPGSSATVLDALVEVQRTQDASLAFRYACRVGMCGSCAVVVNGRERWACRTLLAPLGPRVSVAPLYHFPLVRDLVVDMAPFVSRMRAVGAAFAPVSSPGSGPAATRAPSVARGAAIDGAVECIGCGACLSACSIVGTNPAFPGPAALNRAFSVAADSRDAGGVWARWEALFSEDGVFRCHGQAQCTAVCPMGLSPADSILRLRRMAAGALLSTLPAFPRRAPDRG